MVLVGVERKDRLEDAEMLAEKIVNLRIFPDEQHRMNLSLLDIEGQMLAVSQFTLAGDTRKGRRPSFDRAEAPDKAEPLFNAFTTACQGLGVQTQTGQFRAYMEVALNNTGPVTLLVSSRKEF